MINNKFDEECNIHKARLVKYVCFDKKCIVENLNCVICILENHTECDNNLILEKDELYSKLNFKKLTNEEKKVVNLIKNKIDDSNKKMMKELLKLVREKIKSNDFNFENISKMSLENILKSRNDYEINYDKISKKVKISEIQIKNNNDDRDINKYDEMILKFKRKIDKIFEKFDENYKNTIYENIYQFEKKNFLLPFDSYQLKFQKNSLQFINLKNKGISLKYKFSLKKLSLKVKIEKPSLDYMKFGFILASNSNEIKNQKTFTNTEFIGLSFTSKMNQVNLQGNFLNLDFIEDFLIHVEDGKNIVISSENGEFYGTYNKNDDEKKNLFLYFYITKKDTKVTISKI